MPAAPLDEWIEPLLRWAVEQRGKPGAINVVGWRAWLALDLMLHHCKECPRFHEETAEFRHKEER